MHTQDEWLASKREIVGRYTTSTDRRGTLQLLSVVVPIAGLWYAIYRTSLISLWLVAPEIACLSLLLLRGFVLMHDCGHGSLFRSKSLNRISGFLLGVLAGMPQQVWAENHRYHHSTNGNLSKYRGPLNVACVSEYLAMSAGERRRYRFTRDILMSPIAGCLYFLVNPRITWLRVSWHLARRFFVPSDARETLANTPPRGCASAAHYRHMAGNNLLLLVAAGLVAWAVGPWLFLVCYIVSGSLAGGFGIVLFTVQHNFEHSYASTDEDWNRDEAALSGTSFLVLPRWLNWITADVAYHHVHHLCASVPNYRLAACHKEFEHLFSGVTRVGLVVIPSALRHILWDMPARRLVSVTEATAREAA